MGDNDHGIAVLAWYVMPRLRAGSPVRVGLLYRADRTGCCNQQRSVCCWFCCRCS